MKVKADIVIEIDQSDLAEMGEDIGESLTDHMIYEVKDAIKESDAWRELKNTIFQACIEKIRKEIAKDFVDQLKGES